MDYKNNKNMSRWLFKNKHREAMARTVAFNYLKSNDDLLYNDGLHNLSEKGLARAIQRAPQAMIYALYLAANKRTKELGSFIRTTGEGTLKLLVNEGKISVVKQGPQGDKIVTPAKSKFGYTQHQLLADKSLQKTLKSTIRFLESGGKLDQIITSNEANNVAISLKQILKELQRIMEEMDEDEFFYVDSSSEDVSYMKPDKVLDLLGELIDKVKDASTKTTNNDAKEGFKKIANDLHSFRMEMSAVVGSGKDLGGGKYKHETAEIQPHLDKWEDEIDNIADSASNMFNKYVDISNKILEEEDE